MKSLESMKSEVEHLDRVNWDWHGWGLSGCQFSGETEISTELIHIPRYGKNRRQPLRILPRSLHSLTPQLP